MVQIVDNDQGNNFVMFEKNHNSIFEYLNDKVVSIFLRKVKFLKRLSNC